MPSPNYKDASILIVDDQEANVDLLELFLEEESYTNYTSTSDPRRVVELYHRHSPDLILLDLHMPHLDGFAVMEQLRELIPADTYLPILVLTADANSNVKERALSGGAHDFLVKPLDNIEVVLRIKNLLETRILHSKLAAQNLNLETRVKERTQDLEAAQIETLDRLAMAAEFRDDDTGRHTQRVGNTAALLAQNLGLDETQIDLIRRASPLHDVGKIGTADSILLKQDRLTDAEFETMKQHSIIGAKMLSGSGSPLLQLAEAIALSHHERWDGKGYPASVAGEDIPQVGRIVAVADVFDALTHARPYKAAWPLEEAVNEIKSQSGKQFDPCVVEAFLKLPLADLIDNS